MEVRDGVYALEPQFAQRYFDARVNLSAKDIEANSQLPVPAPGSIESVNDIYRREGNAAVITIEGPLSPEGPDAWDKVMGYGGVAYGTIIAACQRAASDPSIAQVRFESNTPAGTVAGVDEAFQAVRDLAKQKPTVTQVSGMLASAGYYLLCPSKKITASVPTDLIGSIGVIAAGYDLSEYLKGMGVKRVSIVSKHAPKKAAGFDTQAGRDTIQDQVDALERIFYQRVSESRKVTPETIASDFGQGALLVAQDPDPAMPDAQRSGLIDGIESRIGEFPPDDEDDKTQAIHSEHPPRSSGQTIEQEDPYMNLSEFLAQGPAAVAEIDAVKAQAKKDGRTEAQAEHRTADAKLSTIIASESYAKNKVVQAKAAAYLKGEISLEAFETVVATADMLAEQNRSQHAGEEQPGDTRADGGQQNTEELARKARADSIASNWKGAA
jgi:ClpP class serine protease